ncbi:MAG: hypothetical protein QOK29_1030 [Rhodospirillaceae bacterium]|nr:hypothetical protein [Rhodospirillaceae bacterium]
MIFKKLILTSLFAALALSFVAPLSTAYARNGADDPAGHDAGDDHGGQRGGHRGGHR